MGLLSGKKKVVKSSGGEMIQQIPIEYISPDPQQPRKQKRNIEQLAMTVVETKGIQSPLHVIKKGENSYQIITGERRYLGASYLVQQGGDGAIYGKTAPCIVHENDELSHLEILLLQGVENIAREDFTPIEEARYYKRLIDEGKMNQKQVAEKMGLGKSIISETLKILTLPGEYLEQIEQMEKPIAKRDLIKIAREKDEALQLEMLEAIIKELLTVEEDTGMAETATIPSEKDSANDCEIKSGEVWEMLKKAVKKDKDVLLKLISPAKVRKLQEMLEK